MFISGKAQRRGAQSTQLGTSSRNVQSSKISIPKTSALPVSDKQRTMKKRKHATIGSDSASGLLIQGSNEINLYKGSNPDDVEPPLSGNSLRLPDFPISYSGRGIPKFVSPIRISSVDESLSIGNNLNVTGNTTIDGSLTVGGTSLDPSNFMKTNADNDPVTGLQRFTNNTDSTSPSTGAVTVTGGLGVGFNGYFGSSIDVDLNATIGGGIGVAGQVLSTSVDNSIDINSGAIVTSGGAGIAQDVNIGGGLNVGNIMVATGGVGSAGQIITSSTTNSTSVSTGAIVSDGGLGVAQDVYIGGTLNIGGAHLSSNELAGLQSTGLEYGGELTTSSGAAIGISDGKGVIIDSSDPTNLTETLVEWTGLSPYTITTIGTGVFTYIYIDSTGSVVESKVEPTPILRRDNIFLGKVFHIDNVSVNAVNNQPEIYNTSLNQQMDFYRGLGPVVLSGLRVSSNGVNKNIDISAGSLHQMGINFHTDPQQPNVKDFVTSTATTFSMSTQTTVGTPISPGEIDNVNYDVGGTITSIAGSSNQATNMRVYLFNSGFISVQYGQSTYSNLAAAQAALTNESFIVEPFTLSNGILLGIISVTKGCTDLSDTTTATFFAGSKFGEVSIGVGGTATATFQNVYDNSTVPQITLTSALGALQIQDQATPTGGNLFKILDSGGSDILTVSDPRVNVNGGIDIVDNSSGSGPALTITGFNNTEGDIAVPHTESLQIGQVNSGVFTAKVTMNTSGNLVCTNAIEAASADISGLVESATINTTGLATLASMQTDAISSSGLLEVTDTENFKIRSNGGVGGTSFHLIDDSGTTQGYSFWSRDTDNSMGWYDLTQSATFLRYYSQSGTSDSYFVFEPLKDATNKTTASAIFRGGIGVSKKIWGDSLETTNDIYCGGNLEVLGTINNLKIISDDFKKNDTLVVMANATLTEMTAPTFSVTPEDDDDMVDISGLWQIDSSGVTSKDNKSIYFETHRYHQYTSSDSSMSDTGGNTVVITTNDPHGMVTGDSYTVRAVVVTGTGASKYINVGAAVTVNSTTTFEYPSSGPVPDTFTYTSITLERMVCRDRTNGDTDGSSAPNAYFQVSTKYAERLPETGRGYTYYFKYYNFESSYEIALGSSMRVTCLRRPEFTSSEVTYA